MSKNSMPKLREVMGEPKQRFTVKELYVRDASLQLQTVNLGLTEVGNQAKQLKYSGRGSCISYQFREDAKRMATNLNTHLTMMQQRLTCAHVNTFSYL